MVLSMCSLSDEVGVNMEIAPVPLAPPLRSPRAHGLANKIVTLTYIFNKQNNQTRTNLSQYINYCLLIYEEVTNTTI